MRAGTIAMLSDLGLMGVTSWSEAIETANRLARDTGYRWYVFGTPPGHFRPLWHWVEAGERPTLELDAL
jgi:hypothetical protein